MVFRYPPNVFFHHIKNIYSPIIASSNHCEDSGKIILDKAKIRQYWQHANDPTHPGSVQGANIVGLYGDDCKYTDVGEKLIIIAMNLPLFEPKRT